MSKAKAFLYSIRKEQLEINIIREQIRQAELMLLTPAIRYDRDKVQTSPDDPMLKLIVKLDRYEGRLIKHLNRITARREKAFAMIEQIEDADRRQVLTLFFLDERRLTMRQVGEVIGYEIAQTYRIYKAALVELDKHDSK